MIIDILQIPKDHIMKTKIAYTVGSETLQTILIESLKKVFVYKQLINNTENPYILDWISNKVRDTDNFILEVQVQLEAMGLKPNGMSKVHVLINKIAFECNMIFATRDDEFVISECLKTDLNYLNSLSQVRKSSLITDELYQIYSQQIASIKRKPSPNLNRQNILIS